MSGTSSHFSSGSFRLTSTGILRQLWVTTVRQPGGAGTSWTTLQGFYNLKHSETEKKQSSYQVAVPLRNESAQEYRRAYREYWKRWTGPGKKLVVDVCPGEWGRRWRTRWSRRKRS